MIEGYATAAKVPAPAMASTGPLFGFGIPSGSRSVFTPEWSGKGLARWQVRKVADYVRSNLGRAIPLAELASLVRLSRFHFCTAFRLATGRTPQDWITEERIRFATQLLEGHDLSITEIALEVGYETPSSFAARFRQRMGMTPSEYRRAC